MATTMQLYMVQALLLAFAELGWYLAALECNCLIMNAYEWLCIQMIDYRWQHAVMYANALAGVHRYAVAFICFAIHMHTRDLSIDASIFNIPCIVCASV